MVRMDVIAQLGQAAGRSVMEKQAAIPTKVWQPWLRKAFNYITGATGRAAGSAGRAAVSAGGYGARALAGGGIGAASGLAGSGALNTSPENWNAGQLTSAAAGGAAGALLGNTRAARWLGSRSTGLGRTMARHPYLTLGAAPAAYLGGRNLGEEAYYNYQPGFSWNPARWVGNLAPGSHEEAFQRNRDRLADLNKPIVSQMNAASARGEHSEAERLRQQLMSGNSDSGRTLNPFSWLNGTSSRYNQGRALHAQSALQSEYDTAMGTSNSRPGDSASYDNIQLQLSRPGLLRHQAELLNQQAAQIRARLDNPPGLENPAAAAIAERMRTHGMRHVGQALEPSRMRQFYLGSTPNAPGSSGGVNPYSRDLDWAIHSTNALRPPGSLHPEEQGLHPHVQTW